MIRWCRAAEWILLALLVSCAPAVESTAPPAEGTDTSVDRDPLLWRVQGEVDSYLFGTIHLPDARVLALPPSVRAALENCDALFIELDLDEQLPAKLAVAMASPGPDLEERLPPDLYAELTSYTARRGLDVRTLGGLKVFAVEMQLATLDYLEELRTRPALDSWLYERAQDLGKEVGGIETQEEQLGVFDVLREDEQIASLRRSLKKAAEAEAGGVSLTEQLVRTYLLGDPGALEAFFEEQWERDHPLDMRLRSELLVKRNLVMAERIAAKLRSRPKTSFFFALGAGHFPGADGVVQLLRDQGFKLDLQDRHGEVRPPRSP